MRDSYLEHLARRNAAAATTTPARRRPPPPGYEWAIDPDDPWALGGLAFTPLEARARPPVAKLRRVRVPTHPSPPPVPAATHYNGLTRAFEPLQ